MSSKYKEQILKLREKGLGYRKIAKIVGCSTGTVAYNTNSKTRERVKKNRLKNRLCEHPYVSKLQKYARTKDFSYYETKSIYYKLKIFTQIKDEKTMKLKYGKCDIKVEDIFERFGEEPVCYLTGDKINIYKTSSYSFDHMIPRSKGGKNTMQNLGICTTEANKAKQDMTPEEFLEFCKKVVTNSGYKIIEKTK